MIESKDYFFIAGAQRCGSTFLYNMLDMHPEICMAQPVRPEPKFFIKDQEFIKGKEYYLNQHFVNNENYKTAKFFGEKSTSYLEFNFVPKRVQSFFPNSKALVILRNPVDRAISNYLFSVKHKLETRKIEEVFIDDLPNPIINFKTSVSPFSYLERGNYSNYLLPYYEIFGEDLKVVILEELINGETEKEDLYQFLGLKPISKKDEKLDTNSSNYAFLNTEVVASVKEVLHSYYDDEVEKLSIMLNRDLSLWKTK